MHKRILHNTITNNLLTLLRVGAFGKSDSDCLVIMSDDKWRRLVSAAEKLQILPYISTGTTLMSDDKNLSPVLAELLSTKKEEIEKQKDISYNYSKARLYNFFTSHRRDGVINEETSNPEISEDSLNLLDIIISILDDMITKDINIHGLLTLGLYIRQHNKELDRQKINSWLSHIGLVQVASLEGNILIQSFGFTAEELPFYIKERKNSDKILFSKAEHAFRKHSFSNATRMDIAMLETLSYQFMRGITMITDIEE